MTGTVFKHRYEVQEKIGEGSLFTVYKAEDKIDNRVVAVKVLLPQYASNRMFAERILVEAQAMAGISHPGIADVYDAGEEDGSYFVVVEYVRGVDLKERIRRNAPFSLATAVDVGIAICDALDFAHKRGFTNSDLRPGNILVTPEGYIKLTDFWVGNAVSSSQAIRTSAMMRSVHYMAPEVAEGVAASPASDIYSLGIILYELLTGSVPYDSDTPISIALKHAKDPIPSIRAANPGVPKAFETLITKALQKEPDSRFRSAKAMLNDLKSVRDGLNLSRPQTWTPTTEKKTPEPIAVDDDFEEDAPAVLSVLRKTLIVAVAVIAVIATAMVAYVWMNPGEAVVPDIIGKDLITAQTMARKVHITLVVKTEEFNEKYDQGVVLLRESGSRANDQIREDCGNMGKQGIEVRPGPQAEHTSRGDRPQAAHGRGIGGRRTDAGVQRHHRDGQNHQAIARPGHPSDARRSGRTHHQSRPEADRGGLHPA